MTRITSARIKTFPFVKRGKVRNFCGIAFLNLVTNFRKGIPCSKELDIVIKLDPKKLESGDLYIHLNPKLWDLKKLLKFQSDHAYINDRSNSEFEIVHKKTCDYWLRFNAKKEEDNRKKFREKNKKNKKKL